MNDLVDALLTAYPSPTDSKGKVAYMGCKIVGAKVSVQVTGVRSALIPTAEFVFHIEPTAQGRDICNFRPLDLQGRASLVLL